MQALITGASGGLGKEFALIHAQRGHDVILVARSKKKLNALAEYISSTYGVKATIIVQDLTDKNATKKILKQIQGETVELLINNAGVGLRSPFLQSSLEKQQQIIDLNCSALMELTHAFGQRFAQQGFGKILQVASIAAFIPGPRQPVYFASKAFVRSFSHAIAHELAADGVSVTILNPGVTQTNFFNAAQANEVTEGDDPHLVAKFGYQALLAGKREVTYGVKNTLLTQLMRLIPDGLAASMMYRRSTI